MAFRGIFHLNKIVYLRGTLEKKTCLCLTHGDVQQKPTVYSKAIILQFKINNKKMIPFFDW